MREISKHTYAGDASGVDNHSASHAIPSSLTYLIRRHTHDTHLLRLTRIAVKTRFDRVRLTQWEKGKAVRPNASAIVHATHASRDHLPSHPCSLYEISTIEASLVQHCEEDYTHKQGGSEKMRDCMQQYNNDYARIFPHMSYPQPHLSPLQYSSPSAMPP